MLRSAIMIMRVLVFQRCVPTRARSTTRARSGKMAVKRTAPAGMGTWDTISVTTCELCFTTNNTKKNTQFQFHFNLTTNSCEGVWDSPTLGSTLDKSRAVLALFVSCSVIYVSLFALILTPFKDLAMDPIEMRLNKWVIYT